MNPRNKILRNSLLALALFTVAAAQSSEPPLSETRLSIHTLVREDIFAGLISDDIERFSRGEKNIQLLLTQRPGDKSDLLAWQGAAVLYRAVRAYEDKRRDEYQRLSRQALDLLAEARKNDRNGGVAAVTGGIYMVLGDRLPKEDQAPAWAQAYTSFQALWKEQSPIVEKLPLHIKGELLGGLAQSAQRTGRMEEMNLYLDKILLYLKGTSYESVAQKWKANPATATKESITCLSCHEAGRLTARLDQLKSK